MSQCQTQWERTNVPSSLGAARTENDRIFHNIKGCHLWVAEVVFFLLAIFKIVQLL